MQEGNLFQHTGITPYPARQCRNQRAVGLLHLPTTTASSLLRGDERQFRGQWRRGRSGRTKAAFPRRSLPGNAPRPAYQRCGLSSLGGDMRRGHGWPSARTQAPWFGKVRTKQRF